MSARCCRPASRVAAGRGKNSPARHVMRVAKIGEFLFKRIRCRIRFRLQPPRAHGNRTVAPDHLAKRYRDKGHSKAGLRDGWRRPRRETVSAWRRPPRPCACVLLLQPASRHPCGRDEQQQGVIEGITGEPKKRIHACRVARDWSAGRLGRTRGCVKALVTAPRPAGSFHHPLTGRLPPGPARAGSGRAPLTPKLSTFRLAGGLFVRP